jgi:hypothetical protein
MPADFSRVESAPALRYDSIRHCCSLSAAFDHPGAAGSGSGPDLSPFAAAIVGVSAAIVMAANVSQNLWPRKSFLSGTRNDSGKASYVMLESAAVGDTDVDRHSNRTGEVHHRIRHHDIGRAAHRGRHRQTKTAPDSPSSRSNAIAKVEAALQSMISGPRG